MKGFLLGALALVAAVFVATAAGADTKTVQITSAGFTPRVTAIAAGDTVTWHNADTASHQIVANNGSFASPVLKPNDTWSHTFTAATRANYHDTAAATHTGSVVVNGPAPGVSLAADANTVVFRSGTTVTGAITSPTENQQVTLSAQEYGKTTASAQVKSTGTAADGTFSFTVAPTIQTTYIAHWGNAQSTPVTVNVAPSSASATRAPCTRCGCGRTSRTAGTSSGCSATRRSGGGPSSASSSARTVARRSI